ncbi:MAG: DUF2062 domain-containing protein [Oceanobacter sp.]
MPKRLFKRIFPTPEQVQSNKSLRFLSPLFSNPNLWHLNRRSVARAFLIGLFAAFVPMPFQMGLAALLAFFVQANVPIAVGLVWISNPLTIPPLFYGTYLIGAWMLGRPPRNIEVELSVDWVLAELGNVWEPLVIGSLATGILLGLIGYFAINWFWKNHAWNNWKKRPHRHGRLTKRKKKPLTETEESSSAE